MCESLLRCPREQTLHRKIGFLEPPVFFLFFFFSKQGKIAGVAFLEGSVKMGIKLPDYHTNRVLQNKSSTNRLPYSLESAIPRRNRHSVKFRSKCQGSKLLREIATDVLLVHLVLQQPAALIFGISFSKRVLFCTIIRQEFF